MIKVRPSWAFAGRESPCPHCTCYQVGEIVPCSKQLGCELLPAGVYSSIRHCERMTSDTSGSAAALLQSHNLQHKSCVLVCWATKCHGNLISLSPAVTLIGAAFSFSVRILYCLFSLHLIVIKYKIYILPCFLCAVIQSVTLEQPVLCSV